MSKKTMKDYITNVKPLHRKNTITSFPKEKQINIRRIKSKTEIDNFLLAKDKMSKSFAVKNTLTRKSKRKFMIERTIDLHGLTKTEALEAVLKFFVNCRSENIKNVLIITGGSSQRDSVIRQSFIKWIDEYFSEYISSYTIAKPSHGGEGAFYVTLKTLFAI